MHRNGLASILSVVALVVSGAVYLSSRDATPRALAGEKGGPVFAQLSSGKSQIPMTTAPTIALMENNDALGGLVHSDKEKTGEIVVKTPGVYFLIAAAQVGRDKGTSEDYVDLWMKVNGKDVDNSNTRQTIKDSGFTAVLVCQGIAELKTNDVVTLAYSVSSADKGLGIIATSPKGEPTIPSIIFSMYKVN